MSPAARCPYLLMALLSLIAVPASSANTLPWLYQDGIYWKDDQGRQVDLKGLNLGNWLILEMWMTNLFEGVNDQCTLENQLTARFGYAGKESVMKTWRDHWITERDLDLIQALGFNCVRVPFLYSIIEDENNPYTLRPDAWQYLDWIIDQAEQRGMYTILDLHGAVGGQGWEHHTGCAGQNLLWSTPAYQDRTEWLWEHIAVRYRNRSAVAAYDLLNEAWGTDCNTLANFITRLYRAVRAIDPKHTIILADALSCGGIDMYGDPQDDRGMVNVAFTKHPYPGFFGWGSPDLDTHADWLACRGGANSGVCEWLNKMVNTGTAMLFGEIQPWATFGDQGGELARQTFDRYAELGIASTAWAYKVLTTNGSQGNGTWGVVTNAGQPAVAASNWSCPGWNSTFATACSSNDVQYLAPGTGPSTLYVVLKNGALNNGSFDIVWDELSLVHDASGQELLTNGGFGSSTGWSNYLHINPVNRNFAYTGQAPTGGIGPALRMFGTASNNIANGGVYQAVTVQGGETYTLSGVFRDLGSSQAWAEVYLVNTPPVQGQDNPKPDNLPRININTWSQQQIEAYLRTLSTMPYDINDSLQHWLTTSDKPCLIAELCEPPAQSFFAQPHAIPGLIEAEYFDLGGEGDGYHDCDASNNGGAYRPSEGVDIEICSEGGFNVGWLCAGEWLDYQVNVAIPGQYDIAARVASQSTGGAFRIEFNEVDVTGDIAVPVTDDWQSWTTVTATAKLSAGVQKMRFIHDITASGTFNLNHFTFTYRPAAGDIDADGDLDALDIALFTTCLAGPDRPNPGCDPSHFERSDLDQDGDVDSDDLYVLQRSFN